MKKKSIIGYAVNLIKPLKSDINFSHELLRTFLSFCHQQTVSSTRSNVALLLYRASEKNLTIVRNGLDFTRRKRLRFWQFYDAINGSTRKFWHSGEVLCVLENQSIVCIGDSGENIPLLGVLTWRLLKLIKSLYHTGCMSLAQQRGLKKAAGKSLRSHPGAVKGLIGISVSLPSHKEHIVALLSALLYLHKCFCRDKGLCENKMG